jgi:ubiquinone biosynthesis protein Coq4
LAKFDLGGTMQQPDSDAQKRMKELLLIINGAAKELSTKQPGDNVAYLAQVMQDPEEAALIDAIIAEIPDAQEVIDQVS